MSEKLYTMEAVVAMVDGTKVPFTTPIILAGNEAAEAFCQMVEDGVASYDQALAGVKLARSAKATAEYRKWTPEKASAARAWAKANAAEAFEFAQGNDMENEYLRKIYAKHCKA